MVPRTHNGLDSFVCLSAMQKCIRRGLEREAMEFAVELGHTSKGFFTMVCNRLEVICHEDIGLADPQAVMFAMQSIDAARRHYDDKKPGKWRMMLGNALRSMSRAFKSREGDHFQAVVGVPNLEKNIEPVIPDWAYDKHTMMGRKMGRGLDHFRQESAQLVPSAPKDQYEDEAYTLWQWKIDKTADASESPEQWKHMAGGADGGVDTQRSLL